MNIFQRTVYDMNEWAQHWTMYGSLTDGSTRHYLRKSISVEAAKGTIFGRAPR